MICSNPDYLEIVFFIKKIINIAVILAPLILVISGMIEIASVIIKDDADGSKVYKRFLKKLMAAAIIFLIPSILSMCINMVGVDDYNVCLNNATEEYITTAYINRADDAVILAEKELKRDSLSSARGAVDSIKDKVIKKSYDDRLDAVEKSIKEKEEEEKRQNSLSNILGLNGKDNEESYKLALEEYKTKDGKSMSLERQRFISQAISINNKVLYFWGGGHGTIYTQNNGIDPSWGTLKKIGVAGSDRQPLGSTQPYGLDCSGFVSWALANAAVSDSNDKLKYSEGYIYYNNSSKYQVPNVVSGFKALGSKVINYNNILPGDLLYLNDTHIGIYLYTQNGVHYAVHSSGVSSHNGVHITAETYWNYYSNVGF